MVVIGVGLVIGLYSFVYNLWVGVDVVTIESFDVRLWYIVFGLIVVLFVFLDGK